MMSRADGLGHADLLEGEELARDAPQHHADVAALLEDGDAEAEPSPNSKAKSVPPFSCSSCWQRSGVMLFISAVVSSGSSTLVSSRRMRP